MEQFINFYTKPSENKIITRQFFQSINDNLIDITNDIQGFQFSDNLRERNFSQRLKNHMGYRCVEPNEVEYSERTNFHKYINRDIFFQFKKYIPNLPIKYTHFQVRKNFIMPSDNEGNGVEIVYSKRFGIESYNLVTGKQQTLCILSSIDELDASKEMICFDVIKNLGGDYIICSGRADGSVSLYNISRSELDRVKEYKSNIVPKFDNFLSKVISHGNSDEILTNYVKFIKRGNAYNLLTTGNDGWVRIFDLNENFKIVNQIKADYAVNNCDFNLSENIIGCVGDSVYVEMLDIRTSKQFLKFKSHYDYGIALKFQPERDYIFATGNQDYTCKIWDLRKIYGNTESTPLTYLAGNFESIGDLCFSKNRNEKFLIYAENADYLHIYSLKSQALQTLSYLSNMSGLIYNNITSEIYLGVENGNNGGGIIFYDTIKKRFI
jgi:WD40 repeat protein